MVTLRYGLHYFALVFAVGFVLGLVRVPFLEPALGVRWAELIEAPLMWLACYWAAGRVLRQRTVSRPVAALGMGLLALLLMLTVEFSVVLWLRDMTVESWLASRDSVSGPVYALSLVWFALAPLWRWRRCNSAVSGSGDG